MGNQYVLHKGFGTNQSKGLFIGKNGVVTKERHGSCDGLQLYFLNISGFLNFGTWKNGTFNAFEVRWSYMNISGRTKDEHLITNMRPSGLLILFSMLIGDV